MAKTPHHLNRPTTICQVELGKGDIKQGLDNLQGYRQAFVVFRLQGTVVGQVWLPVETGRISAARLRDSLTKMSWAVWQRLMAPPPVSTQPLPTASVAVCTRNRPDDLAHCLPGLSRLAKQGYEVMVIDNCPDDDRSAKLTARYPEIHYIYEPRPGLDVARNRALLLATGEVVAFTDDDAQVDEDWLAALLPNFDDPTVAIVTGLTLPLELETAAQVWFESTNSFSRGFARKQFDAGVINPLAAGAVGAGVNMAIRRSALARIGLFDEALDGGTASRSGGDQEFFYRTLARGYRIVYEPAALVWHRHRRDWTALRNTFQTYGVGLFAWWTRTLLVEKDFSVLPVGLTWFWQYHTRNLVKALLKRNKQTRLDLALAEFKGALQGSFAYLKARKLLKEQFAASSPAAISTTVDPLASLVSGQSLEVQ